MKRTVRPGQVYRDRARDMITRDRQLRVLTLGDDGRAECLVVHDHGGTTGRNPKIKISSLASPAQFDLVQEPDDLTADPRYIALLDALASVHTPNASVDAYARAAWTVLGAPAQSGQ